MFVSPNRQISFQMVGQVGLTVSCPTGYDDKDWEAYIQQARHVRSAGGVIRGVLNFTPSQGPSASQRKRLTDELKEELKPVVRVAVLSDSALLRGVITAMSWFVGGDLTTKSYDPATLEYTGS